ncbi:glycosyltransferase family 39 protein [Candidatus Nitrosopelagicus sp.]|nr:glycosyltransferase family 39 protein [Candidatus Nitrosopelagicus sp.]
MKIFQNSIVIISIIATVALFLRIYSFPYEIPLTLDSLTYFWYSIDLSVTGNFPTISKDIPTGGIYRLPNNGWPVFLSVFMTIFDSENYMDFMNLQRFVSISISIITIVPLYFLFKRYFNKTLALIGTTIFAFHPLIIKNSVIGITEPLFILLGTITIWLFLSKDYKIILISFITAALFTLIRYEGLIIFFPLSILFILKYRKSKNIIFKYSILCIVFVLVLLPMAYIRIETIGHDGIISNILNASKFYVTTATVTNNPETIIDSSIEGKTGLNFIGLGLFNLIKFSGIFSLPYLIFLIPYGLIKIIKDRNFENYTLLSVGFTMILVAVYAFSRDIQDTRYLLILTPIVSVISLFTIQKFLTKIKKEKIFAVIICGIFVVSSWGYLEFTASDEKYEKDAYEFAKIVYEKTDIINGYHPEDKYLRPVIAEFSDHFPKEKSLLPKPIKLINNSSGPNDFSSINELIEKNRDEGLEYIVADDQKHRPQFIQDLYFKEKEFPYLTKVFDSNELDYQYNVKLFFIEYEKYDKKFNQP